MKKRILSLLLAVMLCMSLFAANVSAAALYDYGVCGDNLTWTLSDGVLTISGEGPMTSWASSTNPMWSNYKNEIKSVVIGEGVTDIADYAFYTCNALTTVSIPDSVITVGNYAFAYCGALESIELPAGVSSVMRYAFYCCTALKEVSFSEGIKEIGINAFASCSSLKEITLPASLTRVKDQAFAQCSSLASVTVLNDMTVFGKDVFAQNAINFKMHCNSGSSAEAYAKANGLTFAGIHETHVFGDWTVTKNATCTETGSRTRKCESCDVTETEEIAMLEHTPGAAATCTAPQICTVCETELAPVVPHTPGDEATCTAPQICTVCETELAPVVPHTPGAAATCTAPQICTVCETELAPVVPHTPGAAATCTAPQICTVCEIELAPVVPHTPGDEATCTEDQVCTECGEVLTEAAHTPGPEATCTEDQICTECGEVLAEALGHTEGPAATCTENQVCTECGEILVEAAGHVPGAEATCSHVQTCKVCDAILAKRIPHTPGTSATCTEPGRCAVCGDVTEDPLGHTPGAAATCTSTQNCTVCGEVLAEMIPHDFHDPIIYEHHPHDYHTVCAVCGEYQDTPNAENYLHPGCAECYPYFSLAGANMKLGNDLTIYFYIPKAAIYDDTYYAVLTKYYADGTDPLVLTIPCTEWESYSSSLYRIRLSGISAKEMADVITVQVFNTDGYNVSHIWTDSIKAYLMRNLDGTNFNAKQKTWAVDALNYGAAAQLQFNYNTENLANAELTEEQQALGTQSVTIASNRIMTATCAGSSLNLKNDLSMNVYFSGITDTTGMYATVFYTDHRGNNVDLTVYADSFRKSGALYGVTVDSMVAADARQPITVIMYNANNTVYGRCTDSIEGYAARMTQGDDLYTAVIKFADSAYNMFH